MNDYMNDEQLRAWAIEQAMRTAHAAAVTKTAAEIVEFIRPSVGKNTKQSGTKKRVR